MNSYTWNLEDCRRILPENHEITQSEKWLQFEKVIVLVDFKTLEMTYSWHCRKALPFLGLLTEELEK